MVICFSAGFSYSVLMWPRFAVQSLPTRPLVSNKESSWLLLVGHGTVILKGQQREGFLFFSTFPVGPYIWNFVWKCATFSVRQELSTNINLERKYLNQQRWDIISCYTPLKCICTTARFLASCGLECVRSGNYLNIVGFPGSGLIRISHAGRIRIRHNLKDFLNRHDLLLGTEPDSPNYTKGPDPE